MELMIFDKDINFKEILEKQFSFRNIRRYSEHGEFEINVNFDLEVMDLLQKGNIVYKKGDIEAGIINYRNIKLNEEGKEILVVKGIFITGLLDRRIIWETEVLNSTNEKAIRQIVNNNAINPTIADRKIPLLELGTLNNLTGNIETRVTYQNVLEQIEKIATKSSLGIRTRIDINSKKFLFEVYKGIDRSDTVIFSKDAENILRQEYVDSLDNYKNVGIVAGAGEGIERQKVYIGNGVGLDRFEAYIDARDLSNKKTVNEIEVDIPPAEYIEMLKNRGNIKLSEMTKVKTFDSEIDLNADLKYKIDYDLGDIVTCINKKWGITIKTRITAVEEVYEENGVTINAIFGDKIPDIIDKIKQVVM